MKEDRATITLWVGWGGVCIYTGQKYTEFDLEIDHVDDGNPKINKSYDV